MSNDDLLIINDLHPVARDRFLGFYKALKKSDMSYVRPFEGVRSPQDQETARLKGVSKVGAWRSVHQYGCAVDFVPYMGGKFTWDWDGWEQLHALAERFGLHAPIEWDRAHIVPIGWRTDLRVWLLNNSFT